MPKKRLIFVLLYQDGYFCISRNFRLQKVGTADWLLRNYPFAKVSRYVDEFAILYLDKERDQLDRFLKAVETIVSEIFVPVAMGGGIRDLSHAARYFSHGADKIIVNTLLWSSPAVVEEIANTYGSQAVVASIDYSQGNDQRQLFVRNGLETEVRVGLSEALRRAASLHVGEMLINSVNQDGTGMGLDLQVIDDIPSEVNVPIIMMGGVGRTDHFAPGLKMDRVSAVATSNLFAFIGDGLAAARKSVATAGVNIAIWQ